MLKQLLLTRCQPLNTSSRLIHTFSESCSAGSRSLNFQKNVQNKQKQPSVLNPLRWQHSTPTTPSSSFSSSSQAPRNVPLRGLMPRTVLPCPGNEQELISRLQYGVTEVTSDTVQLGDQLGNTYIFSWFIFVSLFLFSLSLYINMF